jgi:hypothetical protein
MREYIEYKCRGWSVFYKEFYDFVLVEYSREDAQFPWDTHRLTVDKGIVFILEETVLTCSP